MILLITGVLLGLTFTYLAIQNTLGVTFSIGNYAWTNVPLFLIILGSLLIGLLISWVFSLIEGAAAAMSLMGKDRKIHTQESHLQDLEKRIHELELENARLQGTLADKTTKVVEREVVVNEPKQMTLADKIKHRLSF